MKLITWNCNGALRKKFHVLAKLEADIIVVQECEDPEKTNDKNYLKWAADFIWKGDNKNKGVGIFCKNAHQLLENNWDSNGAKHFISVNINNEFNVVAVWNHHAVTPAYRYIGQLWKYLEINKSQLKKAILLGDFNSNKIWDQKNRKWNHTDVVRELEEIGIRSLYHEYFNENQGEEKSPTFYLQRNKLKKYHLDYAFASKELIKNIIEFKVGKSKKWLEWSDHMPLKIEY